MPPEPHPPPPTPMPEPARTPTPTPEEWSEVRRLFEAAVERPREERAAFLSAAARNAVVRAQIERLLRADDVTTQGSRVLELRSLQRALLDGAAAAGGLVGQAAVDEAGDEAADEAAALQGMRIGAFTLRRRIGKGGMGVVFEAEQERPRRLVALKMMTGGLGTGDARRRFEYEAEVLARLRHPGIAQVFEAGTVPLGSAEVPYFAMELIEDARPLDAWAREQSVPLGELLELFARVCDAVHHGHQKGVLHRDLKPANILVDGSGRPKVIDFGIARAIAGGARAHDTAEPPTPPTLRTLPGQVLGTLRYMSPEQLDDDPDLDVRCDVHALGLVLYELLAGRGPFDVEQLPLPAAVRVLRETPAPLPSVRAPDGVRVPPELDWVCLRAIAREREQRYASAAELAQDLRRFLRCEPLTAGPPSAAYRVAKFVRRHRLAVAAVAVALAGLAGGAVALGVGLVRAIDAERVAERRLEQVRSEAAALAELNEFWSDVLASAAPQRDGRDVRVVELLQRAAADADQMLAGRPVQRHLLLGRIGTAYGELGLYDEALPHLQEAVRVTRAALGTGDLRTLQVIRNLGVLHMRRDELDAAEPLLREALAGYRLVVGDDHVETAVTCKTLGHLLHARGHFADAEPYCREAHRVLVQRAGIGDARSVSAASAWAACLGELGRDAEGEEVLRAAIAAGSEQLGADQGNVLNARNNLAVRLRERGDHAGALAEMRAVATGTERRYGPEHPRTLTCLNNLATFLHQLGEVGEAVALLRRLRDVEDARDPESVKGVIMTSNLAAILRQAGELAQAEGLFREAVTRAEAALPAQHWMRGAVAKGLGTCLKERGRFGEAEVVLRQAIETLEATRGLDDARTREALAALAECYDALGDADRAAAARARLQ